MRSSSTRPVVGARRCPPVIDRLASEGAGKPSRDCGQTGRTHARWRNEPVGRAGIAAYEGDGPRPAGREVGASRRPTSRKLWSGSTGFFARESRQVGAGRRANHWRNPTGGSPKPASGLIGSTTPWRRGWPIRSEAIRDQAALGAHPVDARWCRPSAGRTRPADALSRVARGGLRLEGGGHLRTACVLSLSAPKSRTKLASSRAEPGAGMGPPRAGRRFQRQSATVLH